MDSEKILEENFIQGSITSGINAGMIVDEFRKSLFKLNKNDNSLEKKVYYNIDSSLRFSLDSDINKNFQGVMDLKTLVVGAGAIGNYVALNLALAGIKNIDVLDFDDIEDTNLNRQILFYDKMGEKKASVLSERIKEINKLKSRAFNYKIDGNSEKFFEKNKYDFMFGCLDNFRARYYLSEFAKKFKIPLIDGGTNDLSGNLAIYCPNKTPCIKCKKNLTYGDEIKRSCGNALPGVVIPNIITGSMMVGEAINIKRGSILNLRIGYDSFSKDRFYIQRELNSKGDCDCMN